MAVVYRVRHQTLGTVHALKVLRTNKAAVRSRLISEGQLQARIRHPHVVAVTDVLDVHGAPALLMDFVGGGSLAELLKQGSLPPDQALRIFRGVVAGVGHAHSHGLAHRDLKPANILLAPGEDGRLQPRVTDFGLAKMVEDSMVRQHQTREGQAMGTPAYMAPEQIRDAASVDRRADLWSLGVLLYELACGQRPFQASDVVGLMYAVTQGRYAPPRGLRPELPDAVVQAIDGCLVLDRDARIPDCATLQAVLDGQPWQARSPGPELHTWDPDAEPVLPSPPRPTGAEAVPSAVPASQTFDPAALSAPTTAVPAQELPDATTPAAAVPTLTAAQQGGEAEARISRRVPSLVVDQTGRGHVVELVVALVPGGKGVWAPDGVERDARVAAQIAVAVALGAEANTWGVRWGVRGPHGGGSAVALHGTSIGLAVALATRAARQELELPEGWAFTGGVDLDGSVVSVGGLPAKLRAAGAAGLAHVAAPAEDVARLEHGTEPPPLAVEDFEQAVTLLLPSARPRRRWLAAGLVLLLPALLAWSGALLLPEAAVDLQLQRLVGRELALDDVLLLGVDSAEPRSLRSQHAATIDALVDAGARAILVDMALSTATEHDAAIAAAAHRAQDAGVPVALAVRFDRDGPTLPASPELAALPLGSIEMAQDPVFHWVHGLRLRRRDSAGRSYWALPVLGAAAAIGLDEPPRLQAGELVVGVLHAPAASEVLVLPPFPSDVPEIPYGHVEDYGEARGRTVVIGAFGGSDDIHSTADGPRYGPELHLAATQALLRQQAPRRLGPEWRALISLAAGLGTLLVGLRLPFRLRWLAVLPPLAVLAVSLALAAGGVLVGTLGVALGGLGGAWALRRLLRGRSEHAG